MVQKLALRPRWKVCSIDIIWTALADLNRHHLFAWRVRIFQAIHTHVNSCPVGMHKNGQRCTELIEVTANALSGGVVALMLVAVQRDNLELSVKKAVEW